MTSMIANDSDMSNETHRTLTTEAEISAYLHKARMAILEALGGGRATASQIAARLGVHPANLTRHMHVLAEAGLVRLVEKRDTGRNLEKYYEAAAQSFDVAPEADRLSAPHKIALGFARSELSAALASVPDDADGMIQTHVLEARLSPQTVATFARELAALAARFAAADGGGAETYHLVLSLHPGAGRVRERAEVIRLQPRRKRAKPMTR